MKLVILDPDDQQRIIRRRQVTGADRYDEVWNGVYIMSPLADNEHQHLVATLTSGLFFALGDDGATRVYPGVNVSDQETGWERNYRCPDVAVFLPGNPAEDRETHYFGGPDFAVEIVSRYDRSRKKFRFYGSVGVRELLLVSRSPWSLELFRNHNGRWERLGKLKPGDPNAIASTVLPLTFRLVDATPRPKIAVERNDGSMQWLA